MEEDLLKRNTDCVYFLASPLTCRKGAECEYRHSDIARLNPRDCWYWLSGNCLNPSCGFRHPPLEKPTESGTGQDSLQPQQQGIAANKSNVLCYFYFNGFCSKSEKCSFSHGPEMHSLKPTKSCSAVAGVIQGDNKTSPAREIEKTSEFIPPPHSKCSEIHDMVNSSAADHAEAEERMESSPGFDVLVDDEDEDEFRQGSESNGHFGDRNEYDPSYPIPGHYVDGEMIDSHDRVVINNPNSSSFRKRRIFDGQKNTDLRHHLSRRRVSRSENRNEEGDDSRQPSMTGRLRERLVFDRKQLHPAFSGPKSLAQIKVKNRKLDDFEGPKRLSEILKDKRKVTVN